MICYNRIVDIFTSIAIYLIFAALCASCANGQPICTDILLRRGAKITVKNLQETPPLHLAVSNGNWQVTELLIKSEDGCNSIDHIDGKGCTALMMAAKEGHSGLIELIINFRSSASSRQNVLEATDKQGNYIMATILEGSTKIDSNISMIIQIFLTRILIRSHFTDVGLPLGTNDLGSHIN